MVNATSPADAKVAVKNGKTRRKRIIAGFLVAKGPSRKGGFLTVKTVFAILDRSNAQMPVKSRRPVAGIAEATGPGVTILSSDVALR